MKTANIRINTRNKTRKNKQHVNGKIINSKEGWIHLEVGGEPREIGFAHGYLLRSHFSQILKVLPYNVATELNIPYADYLRDCKRLFTPILDDPEWHFIREELHGIVAGAATTGITYDFLVAWNSFLSMCTYYKKNHVDDKGRCSAFIATGSATKTGEIVMAHNTHSDFATGFLMNVVMRIKPDLNDGFLMQTAPGLICSSADWFICENGIIGCETTISNLNFRPEFSIGIPYYLRIRKAMQYGKTLDDYVEIMSKRSAGDYACTWFLGDVNTGEIMMFENGRNHSGVQRTMDGIFHASNDAMTPEVALLETTGVEKYDPDSTTGARYLRMEYLLFDKYKGQLDTGSAKKIMSDHYDVSKSKYNMGKMTICKHAELESDRKKMKGATDGKVVDSTMAKKMQFEGRMGSCCGRIFRRADFNLAKNVPILNMPRHKWTRLG